MRLSLAIVFLLATRALAGSGAPDLRTPARPAAASGSAPPPAAAAPVSFHGKVSLGEAGQAILLVDLDGDATADPIVLFGGKDGCRLSRVTAGPGGPQLVPLAGGVPLAGPTLGDVDGDATPDLVTLATDHLLLRRGLGRGAFAEPIPFPATDGGLLPGPECAGAPPLLADLRGDARAEVVLPVPGGARLVNWPAGAANPANPANPNDAPEELLGSSVARASENGVTLGSPLPSLVGDGPRRAIVLGPLIEPGSPRIDMSWWARTAEGGLEAHRTAFALPPGEAATLVAPLDIEDDGRPELAVLTAPARLESFLGEFGLRLYRASDRADAPVPPFFSTTTSINYWQQPSLSLVRSARGKDLVIAFYRGLVREHLTLSVWRGNGAGSFEPKARESSLESGEAADRSFMLWVDATGDGTLDLLTAGGGRVRVHRGLAGDRPVEETPSVFFDLPAIAKGTVSAGIDASGTLIFNYIAGFQPLLRDLDGDGTMEMLTLAADWQEPADAEETGAPKPRAVRGSGWTLFIHPLRSR